MQNDENWESGIDWSKHTSVVGGPVFYAFIKTQALPTLDDGIQALEAAKAVCEDKMRRWGAISERAGSPIAQRHGPYALQLSQLAEFRP